MLPRYFVPLGLCISISFSVAKAENWKMTDGSAIEGELRGVYRDTAIVASNNQATLVNIGQLDDAAQVLLADHLAAHPFSRPWQASTAALSQEIRDELDVLHGDQLTAFQTGSRAEPDFYLVYFGAYWCGPCREFSPQLVETYNRLKQTSPDAFEVIYVSNDSSVEEQMRYAKTIGMPWPLLRRAKNNQVPGLDRWRRDVPCLVVLTREGDLVFDSYRGEEYLGPRSPLNRFERFLKSIDKETPESQRARHRVAMIQHQRGAAGGDRPLQTYLAPFNPRLYRNVKVPEVWVRLAVDSQGRVTSSEISPPLHAMYEGRLMREASTWLFLPEIKQGSPVAATTDIVLRMQ